MAAQPLVLVVDDEPDFLDIFSTKLSASGFRVETAKDGEEGIKKTKALKPDLVLMDVKMPGLDGAGALLKLREDPETKNTKVVFLTNLGDPRAEIQEINKKFSKEFGAQGYIRKTEDLANLADRVKAFL